MNTRPIGIGRGTPRLSDSDAIIDLDEIETVDNVISDSGDHEGTASTEAALADHAATSHEERPERAAAATSKQKTKEILEPKSRKREENKMALKNPNVSYDRRNAGYNPDLTFTGKNYNAWRRRQENNAIRDGFGDLLSVTEEETKWLNLSRQEQLKQMPEYTVKQEQAKGMLYDCLDVDMFNRVEQAKSFCGILAALDKDFKKHTALDLASTRTTYVTHTYKRGLDFGAWLAENTRLFRLYKEAGGTWDDRERILHIASVVPYDYDPVLREYQRAHAEKKTWTWDDHSKALLDLHARILNDKRFEAEPTTSKRKESYRDDNNWRKRKFKDNNYSRKENKSTDTASRKDWIAPTNDQSKYCTFCRTRGHDLESCFSKKKALRSSAEVPVKEEKHDDVKKPGNWSKFRNFKRRSPARKPAGEGRQAPAFRVDVEAESVQRLEAYDRMHNSALFDVVEVDRTEQVLALCTTIDDVDDSDNTEMVLDSGTKFHMLNDINKFSSTVKIDVPYKVRGVHNAATLICDTVGTVYLKLRDDDGNKLVIRLDNVLYISNLTVNLLSVNRITANGIYGVGFERDEAVIYVIESAKIITRAVEHDGVKWVKYEVTINTNDICALPTVASFDEPDRKDEKYVWHRKFAHLSAKYVALAIEMTAGAPKLAIQPADFTNCAICIEAKMTCTPHTEARTKPQRKFEIICSDILDVAAESLDKKKLLITFIDIFSGFVRIIPIQRKSEAASVWVGYHRHLTNKWPDCPVVTLRCDNAKEYTEGDFRQYNDVNGIVIDSGNAYTPQLNGVAERKNRLILQLIRSMLIDSGVETKYWPYAAAVAEYTLNRSPTKANGLKATPYEIVYGVKPNVSELHPFGCTVMTQIPKEVRVNEATKRRRVGQIKLGPVAKFGIHFGYTNTGYVIYEPTTGKITTSGDVRFDDTTTYRDYVNRKQIVKFVDVDVQPSTSATNDERTDVPIPPDDEDGGLYVYGEYDSFGVGENVTLDETTSALALLGINRSDRAPPPVTLSDSVPKYYAQAISNPNSAEWIRAMECELDSHLENGTWEVVDRPTDANIIKTLWVYTVKHNDDGTERAKARLVAFGCADRNQYEMNETYASVCRIEYIRLILSLSVVYDLKLVSIDVTTAFLYGEIHLDVYISVPPGLDIDSKRYALKLRKALYGLRISSRSWQNTLNQYLISIGFKETAGRCVYMVEKDGDVVLLVTYVDDILLASNCEILLADIIARLDQRFRVKISRAPKNFIGLELSYRADGALIINQSRYIERMAKTFGLTEGRIYHTPMEKDLKLPRSDIPNDDSTFRGMIGALLYACRFSRPDIAFAVNKLSGHQGYVTSEILAYARRIIRYTYHTRNLSLMYVPRDEYPFDAYVDASHGSEEDSKSVSGFVAKHCGNVFDWGTRRQRSVTKSSTEAEVMALCDYIDNIRVPNAMLEEIIGVGSVARVFEDNTSAISALDGGAEKKFKMEHYTSTICQTGNRRR